MRFIGFLLFSCLFLFSCESAPEPQKPTKINEKETELVSKVNGDDLLEAKEKPKGFVQDKNENHTKIVKKYGEQWDFCTCVLANDSINTASQGNLKEQQLEKLMKRWELVENKCREFMTNPNKTPEERELHEKKVQRCLKENGKKMS